MATTTANMRAYPKRKRAEISYCENNSEEENDDECTTSNEVLVNTPRKKVKYTRTTKSLPKRKIFPFTSLPGEIKNQIYDLALTTPCRITLYSKTKRFRRTVDHWPNIKPLMPNLLLLNRAIYAETQPVLYAGNKFSFEDTTGLHAFLAIIGPKNRATLAELRIKRWGHTRTLKAFNHAGRRREPHLLASRLPYCSGCTKGCATIVSRWLPLA